MASEALKGAVRTWARPTTSDTTSELVEKLMATQRLKRTCQRHGLLVKGRSKQQSLCLQPILLEWRHARCLTRHLRSLKRAACQLGNMGTMGCTGLHKGVTGEM